jgi:hypothetical protein
MNHQARFRLKRYSAVVRCAFFSSMLGSDALAGLPSDNCDTDPVQPMASVDTSAESLRGLERTFRLCAEPARAFLKKVGEDVTKAENRKCRTSANQH